VTLSAVALAGFPEIAPGDDLGSLIAERLPSALEPGDAIVVAHKVVSKAEGRVRSLEDVTPSQRALDLAAESDKDPRHVQVVLDEAQEVIRAERGVLICVTRHGFVCANAGVDASNVPGDDSVVMLPSDPDASARMLRARLNDLTGVAPAVVITDSFGRAWRHGQVDVAVGAAGIRPLEDLRGGADYTGRALKATWIAIADELAAAADLVRTKDGGQPVVVIRGMLRHATADDGPGAQALLRPPGEDLFR
jgi:coenzyme F420-0:L-glutamate ligase/coenzyme F420-1:gamma-L-glutamate ligase